MPFIEIERREVSVMVAARLEAVPPIPLRDGEGTVTPERITVVYESPLGGDRWITSAGVYGPRTPSHPGGRLAHLHWKDEGLNEAPDWVEGFVKLSEPDAALRGGVS